MYSTYISYELGHMQNLLLDYPDDPIYRELSKIVYNVPADTRVNVRLNTPWNQKGVWELLVVCGENTVVIPFTFKNSPLGANIFGVLCNIIKMKEKN